MPSTPRFTLAQSDSGKYRRLFSVRLIFAREVLHKNTAKMAHYRTAINTNKNQRPFSWREFFPTGHTSGAFTGGVFLMLFEMDSPRRDDKP